jgi:cellulose synthase/poly-beta-1,6-N-acetylglucosamine synthase-like glycosyltransferase
VIHEGIRDIIVVAWGAVTAVAALLTLPGDLELLALTCASFLRVRLTVPSTTPWRVTVIVPAHNEERSIAACVASILASETDGMEVQVAVIADNCTDATAATARAAGAHVLERFSDAQRGKGYALDFAFRHADLAHADGFLVVDADSRIAENFIAIAAGKLRSGADAVQARYIALNANENTRTRLMALALRGFNVVRPRGRHNLGLSVGILGNGFGLRRETLAAVPYSASSVVEDLEYHLSLVRAGKRVVFADSTAVLGEMTVRSKGAGTQRSRWEGGRLRMLREAAPGLLSDVLRGRLRSVEPLFELLLLPLAFHTVLLLVACSSPWALPRVFGLAGISIVLLHLVAAIVVGGGGWEDAVALAAAPAYILWKVLLIPKLLRGARADEKWVRTERNAEAAEKLHPEEPTSR